MQTDVIGIDLGFVTTGVVCMRGIVIKDFVAIRSQSPPSKPIQKRVKRLVETIGRCININSGGPTLFAFEKPVHNVNPHNLYKQARLLQEAINTLPWMKKDRVIVMAPTQIKKAATGKGNADKKDIFRWAEKKVRFKDDELRKEWLKLSKAKSEAICDAIAIAVAGRKLIGKRKFVDG